MLRMHSWRVVWHLGDQLAKVKLSTIPFVTPLSESPSPLVWEHQQVHVLITARVGAGRGAPGIQGLFEFRRRHCRAMQPLPRGDDASLAPRECGLPTHATPQGEQAVLAQHRV